MMKFEVRNATPADFADILALHHANHVSNVSEQDALDGFLTIPIEEMHLDILREAGSLFVARGENGALAGYVLSAPWDFYGQWPVFGVQTQRFPVVFEGGELNLENSFQYGPVCVARDFRGHGVLAALFGAVRAHFAPRYAFGGTFVNALNQRSLQAHTRKLGFEVVDEWSVNGNDYLTLAFATLQP